jgi:hypothetical protein
MFRTIFLFAVFGVFSASRLCADDAVASHAAVRMAVTKSIPLLERGMRESAAQRKCFTCHNQGVPVFAIVEARKRGFAVDEGGLDAQIRHTLAHLERGRNDFLEGRGQGGKVLSAGYALCTLEAGEWKPDATTSAVSKFLLEYQQEQDHWSHPGNRPPSSGSDFTATYVALRGLSAFGTEEQQSQIEARRQIVREWLLSEKPRHTEDRVFRLRSLQDIDADESEIQKAVQELLCSQQLDDGWAQTDDMQSDAYATGTVLVALIRSGGIAADTPAIVRGVQFLVDNQLDDGSWHVVSRAEPFQPYYESGFPTDPINLSRSVQAVGLRWR